MTVLESRVVVEPGDGSLGPLLRLADDRLAPRAGYGRHAHRAVDVVAVVLAGSLRHRWESGVVLAAGDVAVLRAGTGLAHDEVAGDAGAHVLQAYLRSVAPEAAPGHDVHRSPAGWVPLDRADARLWIRRPPVGQPVAVPSGLLLVADADGVRVERQAGGTVRHTSAATLVVWQLDATRPAWASD